MSAQQGQEQWWESSEAAQQYLLHVAFVRAGLLFGISLTVMVFLSFGAKRICRHLLCSKMLCFKHYYPLIAAPTNSQTPRKIFIICCILLIVSLASLVAFCVGATKGVNLALVVMQGVVKTADHWQETFCSSTKFAVKSTSHFGSHVEGGRLDSMAFGCDRTSWVVRAQTCEFNSSAAQLSVMTEKLLLQCAFITRSND